MSVTWPMSDAALLLWSQLLLAWVVAAYYVGRTASIWGRVHPEPARNWWTAALPRLGLLVAFPILVLGRRPGTALALALVGGMLALALTYMRGKDAWRARGAEIELGLAGVYVLLSALIVGDAGMRPLFALVKLPLSEARVAALTFTATVVLFLIRGGTQVVRAILNKAGSLPQTQTQVDEVEYNRGRLIGSIERLLLAGMAAAGNYAALAFTIAAKGLVRSKQFDDHNFAEYFLIGTLTSTALAMAAGGLLRLVFSALW